MLPLGRPGLSLFAIRGTYLSVLHGSWSVICNPILSRLEQFFAGTRSVGGVRDTAVTALILPRVGVTADLTYVRASNSLDLGHHADVLSYLTGPVYYPVRAGRLTSFVHGLIGGARVTGPIPAGANSFLGGGYANFLVKTSFMGSNVVGTLFASVDLSEAKDLETVNHLGPSSIGVDTIYESQGKIPEVFLRGRGCPNRSLCR